MSKLYAGIGSRSTPTSILAIMEDAATWLAKTGWTLRSGGALGADAAFARGANRRYGSTPASFEIHIPWKGFKHDDTFVLGGQVYHNERHVAIAKKYHPAWERLKRGGQQLMARNVSIMLGSDCDTPVKMVLCWHDPSKKTGGTLQGIRIARDKGIPVFNLAISEDLAKIIAKIDFFSGYS
jgi:hypothetical protein